jgi:RimJ/RimL family protein N-acetyltransferase
MLPDTFQTERLVLRPIAADDAGPIFETYAQDPVVTRFLTWRPHASRPETDTYIARCLATPPDVARTYVLTGGDHPAPFGAFDLRRTAAHRLDFGYVLGRAWWGQGLMTEALRTVVAWAFAQPDVFRIGSFCDVENAGSARVMEKAGLTREGVFRRWLVHPNVSAEPRDCFVYARVREAA